MRKSLILLPLLIGATPAFAQPYDAQPAPPLADPAIADRVADAAQGLTRALLDIRVGELKAAAEGREATPADRRMTIRDLSGRDGHDVDREVQTRIAQARPKIRQGMKALNESLPSVMQSLQQAQKSIE